MKLLAAAFIISATLFSQFVNAKTLTIATEGSYPPFNYIDSNNKLHGFDIDITHALCKKMKIECVITIQDFDGIILGLLAKKYDAIIASLSPTQERLKKIDFTDAYYSTELAAIVPKDSQIKEISVEAFKGKNLGVQLNTTQAIYAENHYASKGVNIKLYPTTKEVIRDLLSNRLDVVILDKLQILDWFKHKGKDCCHFLGSIEGTELPIAIAIRQNNDDLKNQFNKAIKEIRNDGTYDKITKKYFQIDIY
ncbi:MULTISPECIES: transporter substrate-binding domain-containing protein [unclassified Bartonella]|uniref:transporter substrate-binding domain-containing protein n=1 Tax=unclassified Bartonella TaxID=2645622 RepID=UPI000998EF51|nr:MULTISPECIES: transporter substrate-binding domain-containing protein [unclassified Bartonella]AQX18247.1 amino acid ABC transporter substrate-binding protein, PAAT family [Bartonella sp. A1379B]AQX22762.1 polar amino acid transport system substrate-binding protein [Bartonella sp. 11B]AQX23951.1 polar amino acid transport system substrate-binding protein [Bartonella sp. 114]AQX25212.1 amino acid ABC transporter substrate-binding protein, PAAT family [Bartonella sp. Coyote22sub2]